MKYALELKIFPYGTNEYIPITILINVDGNNLIIDIVEGKSEEANEKIVINILDSTKQEKVKIPLDDLGLPSVGALRRWLIALSETAGEIEMYTKD